MNESEYLKESSKFHKNPKRKTINRVAYLALAIGEEAGEVQGEVKKAFRNKEGKITKARKNRIICEMGDLLNVLYRMAEELEVSMKEIHTLHLKKLKSKNKPF